VVEVQLESLRAVVVQLNLELRNDRVDRELTVDRVVGGDARDVVKTFL
jgi:hypothetical protein